MNQLIRAALPARLFMIFTVVVFTLFGSSAAYADVRTKCVDPRPENVRLAGLDQVCFSGHPCFVGVRGAWLDLTYEATPVEGADADVRIVQRGVERSPSVGSCLPLGNSDREGFVIIELTNINRDSDTDNIKIRLNRPRGSDDIRVTVLRGKKFLENRVELSAIHNQLTTLEFRGRRLNQLRLRDPLPGERIDVNQSATRAEVRLIFRTMRDYTADEKLRFTGWVPPINQQSGFPIIRVQSPPGTFRVRNDVSNGWGWVTSEPAGISCPSLCTNVFPAHTNVQFSAIARGDSRFMGWGGERCSGTGPCVIDNGNNTSRFIIWATFAFDYVLNVNVTGLGTVTDDSGQISCPGTNCRLVTQTRNTSITLRAQAAPGQTFLGWSVASCSGQSRCSVRLNQPNQTVTARFTH